MIIARYGYPSETHTIKTDDGYLLTVHRIANPGKPVVYLQHGILSSSADFVVLGPEKALGTCTCKACISSHHTTARRVSATTACLQTKSSRILSWG